MKQAAKDWARQEAETRTSSLEDSMARQARILQNRGLIHEERLATTQSNLVEALRRMRLKQEQEAEIAALAQTEERLAENRAHQSEAQS